MAPLVGPGTCILTLQNGIDSVTGLGEAFGAGRVLGGTAHISAVVQSPGLIRHTATERLFLGEPGGGVSERCRALAAAFEAAGVTAELSPDITLDIWRKFVVLTAFSGITCAARAPIGGIREEPALIDLFRLAVAETIDVGRAAGVSLDEAEAEAAEAGIQVLPPETRSSMLEDLNRGRRLELPWLSGRVAELGRELGQPTPTHSFIDAVLRPHVRGAANRQR